MPLQSGSVDSSYPWCVHVRPATDADAEAIERIRIRGWQIAYRHVFRADELDRLPIDASRWRHNLVEPPRGNAAFVAEQDGRVLGWALVGPSRDVQGAGELYGLYVDPDMWSRGVGRALIRTAEERLAEEYDEAMLWVLDDNPRARRFYELAGWADDGGRSQFERRGFSAPQVRYRKRLTRARSRA